MYLLGIITSSVVGYFVSGKKEEYVRKGRCFIKYMNTVSSVFEIPNGIEEIGERAFKDCVNLQKILIPGIYGSWDLGALVVRKIGKKAFSGCKNLQNLHLGRYVEVCENAFEECANLEKVYLGEGVKVKRNAFLNCINLKKIFVGHSVEIAELSFHNCKNLKIVEFESSPDKIEDKAFFCCENVILVSSFENKYIRQYCADNNLEYKVNAKEYFKDE